MKTVTVSSTAGIIWLLTLTAGLLSQQDRLAAAQQPVEVDRQSTASEQLSQLLEDAVQRVLHRRPATDTGNQLERLQHRLDVLELRLTALADGRCESRQPPAAATCRDCEVRAGVEPEQEPEPETRQKSEAEPEPETGPVENREPRQKLQLPPELESEPGPEPEPKPEPNCEENPSPLSADEAPHQRPAVLACARSCLQLRDRGGSPQDGVYWFTGMPVPTLCDFSHDGGGWTLLLTAVSRDGWNLLSVRSRRERSPSLDDNYSILRHADIVRNLGTGDEFVYRIETQAEKSRQRWGGIWLAPRNYTFMAYTASQTEVTCVRKFDNWKYKSTGIRRRMPWINMSGDDVATSPVVLTTGDGPTPNGWGSLLYDEGSTTYQHSPWSHRDATNSGKVLYWVREEML